MAITEELQREAERREAGAVARGLAEEAGSSSVLRRWWGSHQLNAFTSMRVPISKKVKQEQHCDCQEEHGVFLQSAEQ